MNIGKTRLAICAGFFLAMSGVCFAAGPDSVPRGRIEIVDDLGRSVNLPFPLKRVAVVNSYDVEFVRALGGIDAIVGMDENSARLGDYWPGYSTDNNIGKTQSELNYEKIVSLSPDALIIPRNGAWEAAERKLQPFGIPVFVITGWDVAKHTENIESLGAAFDSKDKALKMVDFYTKYTTLLESRLKNIKRKKVYLENWAKPYISPIPGSGHHDMIVAAGGKNIFDTINFADQPKNKGSVHDFEVDPERILLEDPDLIIKYNNGHYTPLPEAQQKAMLQEMASRPGWGNLKAVRNNALYTISNYAAGASSKLVGMIYIAKWLYPEHMADVDPDAVLREWVEGFQGVPMKSPYVVRLDKK